MIYTVNGHIYNWLLNGYNDKNNFISNTYTFKKKKTIFLLRYKWKNAIVEVIFALFLLLIYFLKVSYTVVKYVVSCASNNRNIMQEILS